MVGMVEIMLQPRIRNWVYSQDHTFLPTYDLNSSLTKHTILIDTARINYCEFLNGHCPMSYKSNIVFPVRASKSSSIRRDNEYIDDEDSD